MKRYKNVGTTPVLDRRMPGDTFDADLPDDLEAFLLRIGALKIISQDVKADDRISKPKPRARVTDADSD